MWSPSSTARLALSPTVLAAQSQREVVPARHRTLAAMTAMTVEQGSVPGRRPPYGYRLVGAGPHLNRAHAQWGSAPGSAGSNLVTAPHVRWMFAQRRARRSIAGIAQEMNERSVPCPSGAGPERNRPRSCVAADSCRSHARGPLLAPHSAGGTATEPTSSRSSPDVPSEDH
jgi:hypothetical protein